MKDLEFISGKFLDCEIPKEKRYLLKYFKTNLQIAFLRYYLTFGTVNNFIDHTGYHCSRWLLYEFKDRYHRLVKAYDEAKKSLTEDGMRIVHLIESGKYPLTGKQKS
jgi:hypothetical protein